MIKLFRKATDCTLCNGLNLLIQDELVCPPGVKSSTQGAATLVNFDFLCTFYTINDHSMCLVVDRVVELDL